MEDDVRNIFYDSWIWQFLAVLLDFTGKALGTAFDPAILIQVLHEDTVFFWAPQF